MKCKFFVIVLISVLTLNTIAYERVVHCKKDTRSLIKKWNGLNQWSMKPTTEKGYHQVASPTKTIGQWIVIDYSLKNTRVSLMTAKNRVTIDFKPDCSQEMSIKELKVAKDYHKQWTDDDLDKLLKAKRTGLIYAWSPNMPLSVDGLKEIQIAAKKLKLPVTFLLDPNASRKSVNKLKKKIGKGDYYKRNYSFELVMNTMDMHYPSIILYKDKKITKYVKHGFEKASGYISDFKEAIK